MGSRAAAALACAFSVILTAATRTDGETYDEARDREPSGSGFIYRKDGQNPPILIKLGAGQGDRFDAILENFKKENGFGRMPPSFADKFASPYNIPVLGQEDRGDVHRDDRGDAPNSYFDDGRYGLSDGGADELLAPVFDGGADRQIDDYRGGFDDDDDGFDFGPSSPFKYHRDVSNDGPKGDSLGYDDENYFGSPYTHKEYKSPGKHHHKAGGSFQKAGHYFSQGTLGDSGYKNHHDFDKAHGGKHGKENLKSHYKKGTGHAHSHKSDTDHYGKHKSGAHGHKGHKFGETDNRKKGHKTTGFHNVYHKDEYNKEQKFYDDAHKQGKFDKYGGKHKDYKHKAGGHKHGSHHESGYDEAHKGAAGDFEKGHYYDGHKGHSGESGHKSHHDHKAGYDTLSDNKKYGEYESGNKKYGEHGESGNKKYGDHGESGGDDFY